MRDSRSCAAQNNCATTQCARARAAAAASNAKLAQIYQQGVHTICVRVCASQRVYSSARRGIAGGESARRCARIRARQSERERERKRESASTGDKEKERKECRELLLLLPPLPLLLSMKLSLSLSLSLSRINANRVRTSEREARRREREGEREKDREQGTRETKLLTSRGCVYACVGCKKRTPFQIGIIADSGGGGGSSGRG